MTLPSSPLAILGLGCAAIAATILLWFLLRRPPLTHAVRIWLLLGLGVFPIGTAISGNIAGYERTKQRTFCGSCHVMIPHASDSNDPNSQSLAARHARNKLFGEENCYACHADYGMFGTITTKMGGMRHVWLYYTEYRDVSLAEAKETIHLRKPYPNSNCMQCHSTEAKLWNEVPDHQASLADVRSGRVSCASGGCHGFAHPTTKSAAQLGEVTAPASPAASPIKKGLPL